MQNARQARQQQMNARNGSRQRANRLLSGQRNQVTGNAQQPKHDYLAKNQFSGIPRSSNVGNKAWPPNKQEQSNQITESKYQPKFNNNLGGIGNGNHRDNGHSIFDKGNGLVYSPSRNDARENGKQGGDQSDLLIENEVLKEELQSIREKMNQMEKLLKEKDVQIQKQRTDLTNLRQKNFKFRSRITELEDKAKLEENTNGVRQNSRNPRAGPRVPTEEDGPSDANAANEMALAMQMHRREMIEREKQMVMMTMMNSLMGAHSAEAEEERLIQQAIEASRGDADPNNPNTDNMTYEQLMELEERNGKVSKGLTQKQIDSIKPKTWMRRSDTEEEACSICFDNFEKYQKFKKLPNCPHEYHAKCIDKWLENEKRCPICNIQVLLNNDKTNVF